MTPTQYVGTQGDRQGHTLTTPCEACATVGNISLGTKKTFLSPADIGIEKKKRNNNTALGTNPLRVLPMLLV